MSRYQTPFLALAAVAYLGATAFAQDATAQPRVKPGTLTDEQFTGARTGTTGTGNSSGAAAIIRTRPAPPGASGGTISPSAGTVEHTSPDTGIIPHVTTNPVPVTPTSPAR